MKTMTGVKGQKKRYPKLQQELIHLFLRKMADSSRRRSRNGYHACRRVKYNIFF